MLEKLHEEISKIAPINGISDLGSGLFSIDFIGHDPDIGADKWDKINRIVDNWPLEKARMAKLAEIEREWDDTIKAGWGSGRGILGLSADDVALLSGLYALAKESVNLGYPIPPIITQDDQEIVFSDIQSMTVFMLQYGGYRSSISQTFASRRRAVNVATTVEQIEGA